MKLFSPKEAKVESQSERQGQVSQVAYLTVTLKKLQDSINKENDNFDKRMAEQRAIYGEEKGRLQTDVRTLDEKIKTRETRLVELLIPIDGMKERAEKVLSKAQETAKSLVEREEEVEELKEALTEKIDDLTERELSVGEKEINIVSRAKGISEEADMVSKSHAKLNIALSEFAKRKQSTESKLARGESSLAIRDKKSKEYLEERTKALDEQERGLRDRRQALERAFEQVEKLKRKK